MRMMRSEGSTMMEMIVIIGIAGIIAGAALPHFDTRRQDVNTALHQLIGEFRTARTSALTTGTHYAVGIPSTGMLKVERMSQAADGTWQVATVTRRINLPTTVSAWVVPSRIEFNTRGTMVTANTPVYVYLSDRYTSTVHAFSVWPSGQVHEEF